MGRVVLKLCGPISKTFGPPPLLVHVVYECRNLTRHIGLYSIGLWTRKKWFTFQLKKIYGVGLKFVVIYNFLYCQKKRNENLLLSGQLSAKMFTRRLKYYTIDGTSSIKLELSIYLGQKNVLFGVNLGQRRY